MRTGPGVVTVFRPYVHILVNGRHGREIHMERQYRYKREEIARSTYALCRAPYTLLVDELEDLEDLLFLAAVAMRLEDTVTHGVMWARDHQDRILSDRNDGYSFSETVSRAINLITATTWVNDFLAAVCPGDRNPKETMIDYADPLEELSMGAERPPVDFAVQAFLMTPVADRATMLWALTKRSTPLC
jgi:hypothetical protein